MAIDGTPHASAGDPDFIGMIDHILAGISDISGFGVLYMGLHDNLQCMRGPVCEFCRLCVEHPATVSLCRYACHHATMQSMASGEPYFQRCWAGLFYATTALAPENACRGGIAVGGFFSPGEERDIESSVSRQVAGLRPEWRRRFLARLDSIRPITPAALRGLGLFVMETTISSGINSDSFFRRQNEKYRQQRAIAEAFHDMRHAPQPATDILGDTYQFISTLYDSDPKRAREFISRYLARILTMSHWNLQCFKANARVLLAAVTSREITEGADWEVALSREMRRLNRLLALSSTDDCCLELADIMMERFSRPAHNDAGGGTILERCRKWMRTHYAEPVTLRDLSHAVGASVSTIVHVIKRETGQATHQLLAGIRIDEARRLLATTTLELATIADMCGFCDQSHFTNAFKRAVNLTPGQFRRLLRVTKDDVLKPI